MYSTARKEVETLKRITKIEANEKLQKAPKKLRVADYARVSTDSR